VGIDGVIVGCEGVYTNVSRLLEVKKRRHAREKSLRPVRSCAWISSPITVSHSPVAEDDAARTQRRHRITLDGPALTCRASADQDEPRASMNGVDLDERGRM
jgi:hypothetical protein